MSFAKYCCLLIVSCFLLPAFCETQQVSLKKGNDILYKEIKPFKILTSGKSITVQSKFSIKKIMIWTASGHRLVEEDKLNALNYSYNISISEKVFFIMLELDGGKRYTAKIGL